MISAKQKFLQKTFIEKLLELDATTLPQWGKMNVQQMIEHMSESIRIANGKFPHQLVTPVEHVERLQAFMLSDREFKPNTPNSLLPVEPVALRNPDKESAVAELQLEINDFVAHFNNEPEKRVMNPFFGNLNFEEWLHLFQKHAIHHLKQFNVAVND